MNNPNLSDTINSGFNPKAKYSLSDLAKIKKINNPTKVTGIPYYFPEMGDFKSLKQFPILMGIDDAYMKYDLLKVAVEDQEIDLIYHFKGLVSQELDTYLPKLQIMIGVSLDQRHWPN